MRAYEFLIEYDRSKTIQSLGKKLSLAIANDSSFDETGNIEKDIDKLFNKIESVDPTQNKQYVRWISNQYKSGNIKYEDLYKLKSDLETFIRFKTQLKRSGHSVDINSYSVQKFTKLIDSLNQVDFDQDSDNKKYKNADDINILYDGPHGILAVPETQEASCELGKGTRWCTAASESDNAFDDYHETGNLYIWRDKSGEKYQFHLDKESGQFSAMDSSDEPLENEDIEQMKQNPVLSKLFDNFDKQISELVKSNLTNIHSRDFSDNIKDYINKMHEDGWPELEEVIYQTKNSDAIVSYAKKIYKNRIPEAEDTILKNPTSALDYTVSVIQGPWPKLESILLSDNKYLNLAINYAIQIKNRQWPELEQKLLKEKNYIHLIHYAQYVKQERWPEADPIICDSAPVDKLFVYVNQIAQEPIKDAETPIATQGSIDMIKMYLSKYKQERWPQAEPTILNSEDQEFLLEYIKHYVEDRWPEAEELILKKMPNLIVPYANNIIGGPWPQAEKYLLNSNKTSYLKQYQDNVIKGRWKKFENHLLSNGSLYDIIDYQNTYIKNKWPAAENELVNRGNPKDILYYLEQVKKETWPDAEPIILHSNDNHYIISYSKIIGSRWPAGEKELLNSGNIYDLLNYVKYVIKGPWPQLETKIKNSEKAMDMYQKTLSQVSV